MLIKTLDKDCHPLWFTIRILVQKACLIRKVSKIVERAKKFGTIDEVMETLLDIGFTYELGIHEYLIYNFINNHTQCYSIPVLLTLMIFTKHTPHKKLINY